MQQRQDPDNAHGTTRVVTRAQFLSQSNHAKRRTAAEKIIKKNAAGKSKKAKKTANSGEKVKKNATMVEMKNAQVFVKIPSRVRIAAAVGTVQGVPVRRSRRSRKFYSRCFYKSNISKLWNSRTCWFNKIFFRWGRRNYLWGS